MQNILNDTNLKDFCLKLKQLRIDLGFKTPAAFAKDLGLKYTTYRNYETNRFAPVEFLILLKQKYSHSVNIDKLFQDALLNDPESIQW